MSEPLNIGKTDNTDYLRTLKYEPKEPIIPTNAVYCSSLTEAALLDCVGQEFSARRVGLSANHVGREIVLGFGIEHELVGRITSYDEETDTAYGAIESVRPVLYPDD